jgi:Winged helix DNA-binding domain
VERLIRQRLDNHKLLQSDLRDAADVVAWLCAVQSQDFAGAKWALAQRATGLSAQAIDQAYERGAILRTHVMRPTWHFVTPADIGWLLTLTAPRVHRLNARYCKANELDSRTVSRARTILARALDGGEHLTRAELGTALRRGRIEASGLRLALITIDAELNQVICSGAMRGKQFTYASFRSRVPRSRELTRDEALAALTRRYFASHGPATLRDFAWWSGLAIRDVKAGVELVRPAIVRETVKDLEYWTLASSAASQSSAPARTSLVSLLPVYDEYLIAYKDREMVVGSGQLFRDAYTNHLVIDGRLGGTWKPTIARDGVTLDVNHYGATTPASQRGLQRAVASYGAFVGKTVTLKAAPTKPRK